jgi:hypothetical protein
MNLEREPMEVPVVGGAKPKLTSTGTGASGSGSGSKKRSPKSPRKSRPNPEMHPSQDTALPPEKPREKRHHKEKRSHRGKQQPEQDPNAPSEGTASGNGNKAKTGDKPPRTRVRQGSQRQSIRRQSQVEHPHDQQQHGRDHRDQRGGDASGRKSKVPEEMSGAGGGVISGAELSDVFDEESQYYPEDSDIKYMEDRSNCRKK